MSEQEQTTSTAEEREAESRPLESADLEKVVGGSETSAKPNFDKWHTLPDGSGSGVGE